MHVGFNQFNAVSVQSLTKQSLDIPLSHKPYYQIQHYVGYLIV